MLLILSTFAIYMDIMPKSMLYRPEMDIYWGYTGLGGARERKAPELTLGGRA